MAQNEFRFDPAQILQPAEPSPLNRKAPVAFGANLTVSRGQAMGRKTSNDKCYPLNLAAADGTQTFAGFNEYSLTTDANGIVYYVWGGTGTGPTFYTVGTSYSGLFTGGVFSPIDVFTAGAGTPTAEVDTFTPGGTLTAGDINTITLPDGATVTFVTATTTAAAIVTGLKAAWAANPVATALAAASGTSTFILTASTPGENLNLASSVVGVGTLTRAITTPAVAAQQSEIDTFTPAGTITTGDVYSITINYPNNTTHVISATVGATTTATAVSALLQAAWNADDLASNYGTASGTSTFIVTGQVGSTMNLTGAVAGVGTISKSVTQPAYGANIADIQSSRPGAYVLPNGHWAVP